MATTTWPSHYFTTAVRAPFSTPNAEPTQQRYHYRVAEANNPLPGSPHILLLHGFPDVASLDLLAEPLSQAGFTCVLPDMLGYGQTSAPSRETELAEYGYRTMVSDLTALMQDKLDSKDQKFVVIGHDFGAVLAWRFAVWVPDQVLGVTGICVPYLPFVSADLLEKENVLKVMPNFGYQSFLADPDNLPLIESHMEPFLMLCHAQPSNYSHAFASHLEFGELGKLEALLRKSNDPSLSAELQKGCLLRGEAWTRALRKFDPKLGGQLDGGLNWYRNKRVCWEEERELKTFALPTLPYLLIMTTRDAALPAALAERMLPHVPEGTLTHKLIEGAGHWPHVEDLNSVVLLIRQWLTDSLGFDSSKRSF